jgi:PrtD family type I secretion system ABC transporter
MRGKSNPHPELLRFQNYIYSVLTFLFVLSGVINILALTGSFYMLQIYDRALTSRSLETLIALSGLTIGLYLFQGVLDVTRSQILVRIGAGFDERFAPLAHRVTIDMPRFGYSSAEASERGRDVDVVRQFLSGQGPTALLDLPWVPIYLAFVYLLHPVLAALVLAGAIVMGTLTLITDRLTKAKSTAVQKAAIARMKLSDTHLRNVEALRAMGFVGRSVERFAEANREHIDLQMRTADVGGSLGGISKVLRLVLQSAVLGVGAYLVINGEMSAGSIIACSVASARALAPVDTAIVQWKGVVAARRSYARLKETLSALNDNAMRVSLPTPMSDLKVEKITVAAPGSGAVVLNEMSLQLAAGQALGLIGPSGSGKSSFARAVTGVWPLVRGCVRLDGADINHWPADRLGRHVGYLPQDVTLLDGTIAQNICRFDPDASGAEIMAAARSAGVHELILRLSDGYETQVGLDGAVLSAGQRQRIALARALYGTPFLVVLDEPNSNLDAEGEAALTQAIASVRDQGSIAIVIAHRPSALEACDTIGVMQAGRLAAFGPKDEVLSKHVQPVRASAHAARPVQGETRWAQR